MSAKPHTVIVRLPSDYRWRRQIAQRLGSWTIWSGGYLIQEPRAVYEILLEKALDFDGFFCRTHQILLEYSQYG
jgi:hypothetical protein